MSSTTADNDLKQKSQAVRYYLENDPVGCDAKWTLFVAAAHSYQYRALLKPFPPSYIDATTGLKNIDALCLDLIFTPPLSLVLERIEKEEYGELKPAVINLLNFVLVELNESVLHSIDLADFEDVLHSMGQSDDVPRPTHVFKVGKGNTPREVVLREQLPQTESLKLAFHGNKLSRFFEMLMRSSNAGDDEDTAVLLNTDLGTCCKISPYNPGWGCSCCGPMISCVALCEYNDPEYSEGNVALVRKKSKVRILYLLLYGRGFPNDGEEGTPRLR